MIINVLIRADMDNEYFRRFANFLVLREKNSTQDIFIVI
jgi:hypothetical protein